MLAILSKSIAIIGSDTAEILPIAILAPDSIADSDTSKVSPTVSLSMAIIDINNPDVHLPEIYRFTVLLLDFKGRFQSIL
jgi:hypothetical protein